jgi:hypothetical protein
MTMLRAIGAADAVVPTDVRSKVEVFLAAQTVLAQGAVHALYGVVRPSVVPVRPPEQADISTGEMPAVIDTEEMPVAFEQTDEERYKAALQEIANRQAAYDALHRARAVAQEHPPQDPMYSPLVREAVRRLAVAGDLGALDLLERYSDDFSGPLGTLVTRVTAMWPPFRR